MLNAPQRTVECWIDQVCQEMKCEAVLRINAPYENLIFTILHLVWFQLSNQGLSHQSTARYCGVELPPVYVSSGSRMTVMFSAVTSGSGRRQGFLLTYRAKTSASESPDTTAEPLNTGEWGLVGASSHQGLCSWLRHLCLFCRII